MSLSETTCRDPGEVPVLDWIDKSLIDIDPDYQRGLDAARVRRIVDWFEWSSFGSSSGSMNRSSKYWLPSALTAM